jgi:hypothetical protein
MGSRARGRRSATLAECVRPTRAREHPSHRRVAREVDWPRQHGSRSNRRAVNRGWGRPSCGRSSCSRVEPPGLLCALWSRRPALLDRRPQIRIRQRRRWYVVLPFATAAQAGPSSVRVHTQGQWRGWLRRCRQVTGDARPIKQFTVGSAGRQVPILDLPLDAERFDREQAIKDPDFFANQNSALRKTHRYTLDKLTEEFGLEPSQERAGSD